MSEGDDSKVNQAGSQGEKTDTEAIPLQAPASNPGSDDPSGGIATSSGGVSSAAYVLSPVPNEQKSVVQATVDTVKSYLPSLAGLSLGGSKTEDQEAKNAGGEETATAAGGITAAASTAAVALGLKSENAAPTDSADATEDSTSKDVAMADSDQKEGVKTDTENQVSEVKDEGKSSDAAPTDRANEESAAKTDTEGAKPGEGGGGSEETSGQEGSELKKTPTGKENRQAIPTAGGERLGDKHWGESQVVPDVPKKQDNESTQVSSAEGQPDKTTQDNTAQNTGGAAPPTSSAPAADKGGEKEKTSFKDKVKAKLNIGKKDKA